MEQDTDVFGQEIKEGDFVVYAISARSAPMCYGRVMKLSVGGELRYFHILGVRRDWNYNYDTKKRDFLGYKLNEKPGRVLGGNQILVVNDKMPEAIKKLYN